MRSTNSVARIVGLLFIVGTVAGVLSGALWTPYLTIQSDGSSYLAQVAGNELQLIAGALLVLLMGFSLALIPIVLYPLLKQYSETLAIGYVVFRGTLEFVTYLVLVGMLMTIVTVSRGGGLSDETVRPSLSVLLSGYDVVFSILLTMIFAAGALILYYVLYQSRLVPRWLSGWGLAAAALWFAWGLILMFGLSNTEATIRLGVTLPVETIFALPIALQEMVMALWLIVRGFDDSSLREARSIEATPNAPDLSD